MISEDTQTILRNFSGINPSILLTGNNRIATMSVMRNILATADIEELAPFLVVSGQAQLCTLFAHYGLGHSESVWI